MCPLYKHDTFNIGIKLDFHGQITNVEFVDVVVYLHNIKQEKGSPL